ncbi:MAG: hypothetical protein CR984_03685 [Proteobacteria bacterium]|nr:MAG: hypothetical protein CR984_03685 [Pseudomonadota bacterium]PIE67965.1 MAG: hypothetical protein CSA23_01215 [Deltaproteobacteria bacterium]
MPAWSQPEDLKSWCVNGVSIRGVLVVLALSALLISEVRFSWVEILVGRYLAETNRHRPESGSVWEQGRVKQTASRTLEQIVTRQLTVQREARQAKSLGELIESLDDTRGAMISAAHFKTLYSRLPERLARNIFSPVLVLRISAEKHWDRVYLERDGEQVGIYLLDRSNNVLSTATLTDQQLAAVHSQPPLLAGSLDMRPEFNGRIYAADRFFMALDSLPAETQQAVLTHPGSVLAAEGVPVRVGISDEVSGDMIRIGIEMETPEGTQIFFGAGQEWAVWQVRMLLAPHLSSPSDNATRWSFGGGDP